MREKATRHSNCEYDHRAVSGGFFVSVLGNMSVAGISLLTIVSIACVGLIVFLIVKVFTK